MRSAGNFNSEWGYLAPAPSFMRTARIVLVATAIGATAGAAVVLSLIDHPAAERDKTASITAHAIVTSAQAAPATTTPPPSSATAALAAPVSVTTVVSTPVSPTAQAQATAPITPQVAPRAAPPATPQVAMRPPPAAMQSAAIAPQPSAINPSVSKNPARAMQPRLRRQSRRRGIASLSDVPPATEAASAEAPDQAMIPPQTVPPDKKPKHRAAYASDSKYKPAAGLGTVLRRLFSPHNGTSYYPSR